MRVQGYNGDGELKICDVFVRDDPSLDRAYPAGMEVTDETCIEVCYTTAVFSTLASISQNVAKMLLEVAKP